MNAITEIISPIRQKIRDFYRIDETQAVEYVLPEAEIKLRARSRAWERARNMVLRIREEHSAHGGVDALLNEYSLSTAEGVVLMCMAEALLRIPDEETQEALIRDKLSKGQWSSHLGNSDSLFVNASAWGLLFTGNMVKYGDDKKREQFNLLKRTIGRLGEPVIRRSMTIAMRVMGKQFVMGETIQDAVKRARDKEQKGYVYSYDMLGEGARNWHDADRYFNAYVNAIKVIGASAKHSSVRKNPGISVKLSAIHPKYDWRNREQAVPTLVARLLELCVMAKDLNISLTVDAEESERLEISLDIIERVFFASELDGWEGFGIALQAYQKRAIFVCDYLYELATQANKKMLVRLVKGAYWDSEIKHSQQLGVDEFPVFTRKSSTDVSYHACANRLLAYRDYIYPQFATHNAYTASIILELAAEDKEGFEFQCLHGMGDTLYDEIVREQGIQCRIYAPVGEHQDLLAYLVRRLLENGANSSFVNAIVDDSKPVESLLKDPVERTLRLPTKYNKRVVKARDLYAPERVNSEGFDIYDINQHEQLRFELTRHFERLDAVAAELQDEPFDGTLLPIHNPYHGQQVLGNIPLDNADSILHKLSKANEFHLSWSQYHVDQRAEILELTADALERHRAELIALCMKEAGKVLQDSIDEIREAVDFCRYYAVHARQLSLNPKLQSRGVVLCISPWNFPLAIFLGQVAAALVCGNTVLAKPAEQTSLIAIRTVELMRMVGLPEDALQLVLGPGRLVGDTLLPDERVAAVMFTGSTKTGNLISRTLGERGAEQVPLIAETGGQNCMIVDSSALPEQVVDDVLQSGFQSAGQRCSALRVLYLQEDIADRVITMLIGAMQTLSIGDPTELVTDVGPVIDELALERLQSHQGYMQAMIEAGRAKLLHQNPVPDAPGALLFPPTLYEIDSLSLLGEEVFGPVVHVVRYRRGTIDQVVEEINATGYGLTAGIHSRIDDRAAELAHKLKVGNVYINRNMIGAIVGVQPFGGRGLSGTGPKAGGPNYLLRLMMEVDTPESDEDTTSYEDDSKVQSSEGDFERVEALMTEANKAFDRWQAWTVNGRVSLIRQLLAKIAMIESVDKITDDLEQTLAISRSQLYAIESFLERPVILPGPTGERNSLEYASRGIILCLADERVAFEYFMISMISALATGNVVVAVVEHQFYEETLEFRDKLATLGAVPNLLQVAEMSQLEALLMHPDLTGVVVESSSQRTTRVAGKVAQREGTIIPVVTAQYNDNLYKRLLTEKVVSVDTTASGGNTSLMTLVDEDD